MSWQIATTAFLLFLSGAAGAQESDSTGTSLTFCKIVGLSGKRITAEILFSDWTLRVWTTPEDEAPPESLEEVEISALCDLLRGADFSKDVDFSKPVPGEPQTNHDGDRCQLTLKIRNQSRTLSWVDANRRTPFELKAVGMALGKMISRYRNLHKGGRD